MQTRATPGRVGHREVVAGLQRVLVVLLDLAAAVHRERAVDVVEHPRAAGRADRAQDLLPVRLVAGVDRELAHPLALGAGAGHEVDALQRPAGLGDLRRSACPAAPARASSSTRTVTENWAETRWHGHRTRGRSLRERRTGKLPDPGAGPIAEAGAGRTPSIGCEWRGRRRRRADRDGEAAGDGELFLIDGTPRLPGLLRAAGVDRDRRRAADERDLRVRLDDGQDPHRPLGRRP